MAKDRLLSDMCLGDFGAYGQCVKERGHEETLCQDAFGHTFTAREGTRREKDMANEDDLLTALLIVVEDTRDVTEDGLSPEECVRIVREDLTEDDLKPENMSNDSPELREAYEVVRNAEQSDISELIPHLV